MTTDPALYQEFERDRAVCQTANFGSDAKPSARGGYSGFAPGNEGSQDCMASKGYIVVTADAAAAKQAELAAKAAEKARLEAEAAAPPPPPPPPPRRVAAKPKPKPKPPTTPPAPQNPQN